MADNRGLRLNIVADDRGRNGEGADISKVLEVLVFLEQVIRKWKGQPKGVHSKMAKAGDNKLVDNREINRVSDNRGINRANNRVTDGGIIKFLGYV